jgi:predicted HicB family RNase H-like nuclease
MKYKNYTAVIEVDEESGLLFGHVIGLRDGINFQGETISELRKSFEESVDCYLEFCTSRNKSPEKPFSGKFLVRIPSALHRALVEASQTRGVSLNSLVESTLSDAFAVEASEASAKPRVQKPRRAKAKISSPEITPSKAKSKTRPAARSTR